MFEYSSEDLDTGIATIDAIETKYSQDMLEYQFKKEDGGLFLKEDGGSLITEAYQTSVSEPIDNAEPIPPCDRVMNSPVLNSAKPVATLLSLNTALIGVLLAIFYI